MGASSEPDRNPASAADAAASGRAVGTGASPSRRYPPGVKLEGTSPKNRAGGSTPCGPFAMRKLAGSLRLDRKLAARSRRALA